MARALRYNFIVGLVALSAALAAAGGWKYARASAPVSGPIVLISIDGLRTDHLHPYGYRGVETPAIDRLAADGVLFERAYSHVPQSLPAHAAMFTGRLPFESEVRDGVGFNLKSGDRSLAEILRDRGYATAGIVSTLDLAARSGISRGFQFFDEKMSPADESTSIGEICRDGLLSEQAAERWLESTGTERAFLFLQLPVRTPARQQPYDDGVAAADGAIGQFVRYLKTHQLYDQSTIVLVGTYGDGLGDHQEENNGLLVYEEALHVPLIVKQAAGEGAGVRVGDLVQHIDLMPTLLDLAKAPIPGNVQGRSLKPLLDGTGHFSERTVYSESLYGYYHFGLAPLRTITDGAYRYIDAPTAELYDIAADPREKTNIAGDPVQTATVKSLKNQLARLGANGLLPVPGEVAAPDRDRLSVLGYVGRQDLQADAGPEAAIDPRDKALLVRDYRAAVAMAFNRRWTEATDVLQAILRSEPRRVDIWADLAAFALRSNRIDLAVDAYKHIAMLRPGDAGASGRVRQLKEFADARAMFNRQRYRAALPMFEDAIEQVAQASGGPIADLHYYAAATLARLDRQEDAQAELLKELQDFPDNLKARAELAKLAPSER